MRFLKSAICVVLAFFCLSLSVFAYQLPHVYQKDGYSTIGIFEIAKWKDNPIESGFNVYDYWASFKSSNQNLIFYDPDGDCYTFMIVPDGAKVSFQNDINGVRVISSVHIPAGYFSRSGDKYVFDGYAPYNSFILPVLVGGSYFNTHPPFPNLPQSVVAEYGGDTLAIEDDLGEKPDDGGFWSKLLAWLSSFWDKLKSFFVPSEGYFDDWFNEIRSAFNQKLGGLDSIFKRISSSFENMSSSNFALKVVIPKGVFYSGFAGYEVNLVPHMQPILNFIRPIFTAFIVVMTVISCYKRLIEVINT